MIGTNSLLTARRDTDEECLALQNEDKGGISDRPEDMVDVFHTFFGIAALSLMGHSDLEPINPAYALPVATLQKVLPI